MNHEPGQYVGRLVATGSARRAPWLIAIALASALVTTSSTLAPARAAETPHNVLDEHTALTIGAGRVKLGVLAFEVGMTDWLSLGTDPPGWAVRSVSPVIIPNLHLKGSLLRRPDAVVSARLAAYYADVSSSTADGQLLLVPLSLFVSARLMPRLWAHFEGNYNWTRGFGAGDLTDAQIAGALVMRTAQVGLMFELRLTRVIALLARGRYQPYSSPLFLHGADNVDPYTHADLSIEARNPNPHPAMAVAGASFTWSNVGLVVGAGYGNYFIPGANLALPYQTVTPEGSLWVVF